MKTLFTVNFLEGLQRETSLVLDSSISKTQQAMSFNRTSTDVRGFEKAGGMLFGRKTLHNQPKAWHNSTL